MQILKTERGSKTFYYNGNYEVLAVVKPKGGSPFWTLHRYTGANQSVDFPTRTGAEHAVENGHEILKARS